MWIGHHKEIWKLTSQALALLRIESERTRSDERLTLETSASQSLYGGLFTLSTQSIKPNYFVILPPMQHYSFFRNLPPITNTSTGNSFFLYSSKRFFNWQVSPKAKYCSCMLLWLYDSVGHIHWSETIPVTLFFKLIAGYIKKPRLKPLDVCVYIA